MRSLLVLATLSICGVLLVERTCRAEPIGNYRYPNFANLTVWPLVSIEVLNGSLPWADDFTSPDGFVRIYVGDQLIASTATILDEYYPQWNFKTRANSVDWEEAITFKVIDYDYMSKDDVLGTPSLTLRRILYDGHNGAVQRLAFRGGHVNVKLSVVTVPSCGFNQPQGDGWRQWVGSGGESGPEYNVTVTDGDGESQGEVIPPFTIEPESAGRMKKNRLRRALIERSGRKVQESEFPWHVSLQKWGNLLSENEDGLRHFCSATILNNNYIIAAAQCVANENAGDLMAVVGTSRLNGQDTKPLKYKITSIRIHPHYNNVTKEYDLALLRTEEPMEFYYRSTGLLDGAGSVNSICLMPEVDPTASRVLTITAWDSKSAASGREEHLRKVDLMTLDLESCEHRVRLLRTTHFSTLKGFICTTGVMKSEEHADIGTALSRNLADRWFLYGTLSSSFPHVKRHQDGQFIVPGLFTNIMKNLNWIESIATDFSLR